jgi:hypothetical protein
MADETDLLSQPFVDWESVTKGATYNESDGKSRLDLFNNWSAYAKDYSAKQLAEAPEDTKNEAQQNADSINSFIEERSGFLKSKYDLVHRISKMKTSEEVIDALRDPDKLRQEGFGDEEIFALRQSAEKEFAPVLAQSQAGTLSENEAAKALWESPGFLDAAANFAYRALPVMATTVLRTVEGVTDLAGKANEINPAASDFEQDLGRSVAQKVTRAAREGADWINKSFPSDPRLSENTLAASEGLAQVPVNLATAALGTVPNVISNYGQMYQENVDAYTPQITEQRYKDEIRSGRASATTPFKQWESLLSKEEKKDIRAEAATKAMLVAVPQSVIETFSDKLLLNNIPLPKSVKSKLMAWRNSAPVSYIGARVATNAFGKTAVESVTEGGQTILKNIGGATNTGDWSMKALTQDLEPSMIGGAFGGAGATVLTLPNTFRTERAIDWAQSIVNGQNEAAQKDIAIIKSKDADIESKEYKAAYARVKNKDQADYEHQFDLAFINDPAVDKNSVEFKDAEKRIQVREDEANWVLDRVGDSRADKNRAARYQAVSDTRREFETALTKHIRDNEPNWGDPSKEYQTRFKQIKDQFAIVRQGAKETGSNLNLDAAENQAIEQLKKTTSEKSKNAEKLINDFVGSVDSDGPGRAIFARQELARLYPDSVFSPWFTDDATVVELLNAREKGEINDETNPEEWLNSTVSTTKSTKEPKTEATPKPQGLMTTGQRLDAFRLAEDNLAGASESEVKEFGRLKDDINFWNSVLNDKDSNEQDRAEAEQRLPALENALLDLATVSSQSTNQNDQNQTPNQTSVSSQEVSATGATGQGTGAGEPFTIVRNMDGEEKIQTERDYINESRGIVTALLGTNEAGITMTPEAALQNVEAVRQEIEAAPDLTPEQKQQWASHFQNIPALAEQQRAQQTTPNASTAPAAASGVSETTESPELIAGEGTISEAPTPVRMSSIPGDVSRTESGEVVFRPTDGSPETVLRVKETSIEKDPATLTVADFESGDGTPLVSEANKQFSVLPQSDRPVRPFFRSGPTITSQDGQTAKSSGSYPEAAGSTPAPATTLSPADQTQGGEIQNEIQQTEPLREGQTSSSSPQGQSGSSQEQGQEISQPNEEGSPVTGAPDLQAIVADVQANPEVHRSKDGNRKLVSREAAVTILSQLPDTLTNKDAATLAKDSGMSSANFRKLVGMRGDQNATGSILNGGMDAELGLFQRSPDTQTTSQKKEAPEVALEDTPEWRALSETSIEDAPEWQALSDGFDKSYEKVSDLGLDAETPRSKAVSVAKKLLADGAISQRDADEAIRSAQDKSYDREDAVSEALSVLESGLQYTLEEKQNSLRQKFDADLEGKRQALKESFEARRIQATATTTPATKVSNDTKTESTLTNQSQVDRWVNDSFTAIEEKIASMPMSKLAAAGMREKLTTDEGRAQVREKLGQMFNTAARNIGIADPITKEEALEKIFRGAKSQTGEGLTSNVLNDLLTNVEKTGDPFLVKTKNGEVGYSAWLKHRNKQKEFLDAQGKRDMTDKLVENQGASTTASQGVQEEEGEGTGPSFTEGDPDMEAGRAEVKSMQREAVQGAYEKIARSLAGQFGLDRDAVKSAIAKHFSSKRGVKLDFEGLGWATPTRSKEEKAVAALKNAMPQIEQQLIGELTKAIRSATSEANRLGLLKSDPVEISDTPTLEQILGLGIRDEIENPDFYNAINEAKEKKSVEPLKPLLEGIGRTAIRDLQVVAGVVLNDGKPITDAKRLASLNKADMQAVLDSNLLSGRVRQTLQALNDLSGSDGLGIVRTSKNEGFRRLAELYSEQIGNRAPVEVVFNLALNPEVNAQGLWNPGDNRVHISPFLTREQNLMEATILHETMHPIWDGKINDFLNGRLDRLNAKELGAARELERLFTYAKAEALKRPELSERDVTGLGDLREFLNEALNHKPFQDFLNELKDPESKDKTSIFRKILNEILKLIRGGDVSVDSVLQRAFEVSVDLASGTQSPSQQTPTRLPETRAEADIRAAEIFSEIELASYNALRQMQDESVLASDAYEFVSPNDLEESLDLNGAINELGSQRQAQLREFSGRVHEAFGMQGSTVTDAIGDWADGAEPTTVTEHTNPNLSYEDIKTMAALKGALRNQKAVIPFKVDGNGEQFLYDFFIPEKSLREAREIVAQAGIEFRTLTEQNGGTRVLVFDADGSAFDAFAGLISNNKYESKFLTGNGEFLGSWDSREEGKEVYTRTVAAEIARLGGEGRDVRPDSPEGVRIASLRSLAAEAGLTLDPAPELSVVEALTGQPPTAEEAARFSRKVELNETPSSVSNNEYYENLTHKGIDPITGSRSAIGRRANRRNGARRDSSQGNEGAPTRGADFPDEVRRRDRATHQELERTRSGINEAFGGVLSFQSIELVNYLRGKTIAPEGSALAETVASLREAIPVLPNNVLEGLKQLSEGMSSKVFADSKNDSVYKLLSVSEKGTVGGTFPKDLRIRAADDTVVIASEKDPSLIEFLRAIAISNVQGNAVFTEIAGVTEDGDVILKQPYIKGLTPTDNFEDPEGFREALRDLGLSMLSDIGAVSAVGKVGDRYALFDDLHGENVMRDKNGRAQLVDALATRLLSNDEYTSVSPYLKDAEVLRSVKVPYKDAVDRSLGNVLEKTTPEPAQSEFLKPEAFSKAKDAILNIIQTPELARLKARGGRLVNLNSPDDSTARKLQAATGQRWDSPRRMLEARAIHALTENDRTTPNANKVATAQLIPQTLRQADFVARNDFEGRPFLVFAKLYTDPNSPTGVRWHFVEAREDTGAFETQYSDTNPQRGRALASKVIGIGDATPKKQKALTEAGYAQGTAGESPSPLQGIEPDVSSGQGEVLDNTNVESVQNKISEEIAALNEKFERLMQSGNSEAANKAAEQIDELERQLGPRKSRPVPFSGSVVAGFNPTVYTNADRRQTGALARVRTEPEYRAVQAALGSKSYFKYTEAETLTKANEFIDANGGDLEKAYIKAGSAHGLTSEQTIVARGLVLKRATAAANAARAGKADPNASAQQKTNFAIVEQHYTDLAETFAEGLMEMASLAGQELRAFRMLADALTPQSWGKVYKKAATKAQKKKIEKDPALREAMARIKEARRIAANSTTTRMLKALAIAAKRFVPEGTSDEEIAAYENFDRLMASNLPVREEVMKAAIERTVISGVDTIRRAMAPQEQVPESFLREWEDRLRNIASQQINDIIETRLQGGKIDEELPAELSDSEKEALREQKIMDAWREFSDYPLAEMVFNLARSTIVASDSPYANLVRRAQFDPARINALQNAVKMTINTAEEIRKSVTDRRMSVESLKLRLAEANPSLNEAQLGSLASAVEAVYNDEVEQATRAALDRVIKTHAEKKAAKVLQDPNVIDKLLPLVNMGAFSDEAAYNAIAEGLRLPTWNSETAAQIEEKAKALQALPEGSLQRQEAGQTLMLDILKANIKEAKGTGRIGHIIQISSALWSAGILSAPPTQIVNASMTSVSVFLESFMEATGYWTRATLNGASQEQAREYFKDIARAWLFAFGKDANNTSLRAINEAYSSLTTGRSKFKSEKLENMSPLEMFKFDPRVAIPGNAMMDAIISGEYLKATKEAAKMAVGVPVTMADRLGKKDLKGAVKDYMATAKLVGRLMMASDSVNSYGAATAKQMMMMRYLAQEEGMAPDQINEMMRKARKNEEESISDGAMAQVQTEDEQGNFGPAGTKAHDVARARRLEQIIEQQTYGADTVNAGRDFAAIATFNSEPYGVVGWLMDTLFAGPTKILGLATKPINPFPKTMSNLINAALNYTPYGSLRAEGVNIGAFVATVPNFPEQFVRETPERGTPEYFALHARALAGSAAMGTFALMLMGAVKDRKEKKEPWFEIHGPGPSDPAQLKQWAASGAKKFTVKIGQGDGALVVSYTDWPGINIALGVLGTLYDQMVYSDAEMETADWMSQTARAVTMVTLNRSALGGASALMEFLSASTPEVVAKTKFQQLASSYVTGFTRPSFVRWAETVVTGQRQETRTTEGWLLSLTPVVSAFRGRPALNILGEPIETSAWDATAGRVATSQQTHPVLTSLTNAQLWIPPAQRYDLFDDSQPTMVRKMTEAEFYNYGKYYGESLREIVTPAMAESLAELAKTAPNTAQEMLTNLSNTASKIAKAKMAGGGIVKGKEFKGP